VNGRDIELQHDSVGKTGFAAALPIIPASWFVATLTFSIVLVAGMMIHRGLVITLASPALVAITGAMATLAALRYTMADRTTPGQKRLRDFSEYCLLFMVVTLTGVIASYPVAAVSSGFSDASLTRIDQLMHFDWNGWYAYVAERPTLQHVGVIAYATIYLSPAILLGYMAWTNQKAAARQFLFSFWLAAAITLLLFPLFPAKGPLAYQWTGAIPYMPTSALYQSEMIPELRANLLTAIDMGALRGLVCAPSFHTVSAVLYIAAAWSLPRLRWIVLPINFAMILSIPVEGNHYLADMLIGATVAISAIFIVKACMRLLVDNPLDHAVPTMLAPQPQ
jgi:hypothetical protein